jgi:hypothetical protein
MIWVQHDFYQNFVSSVDSSDIELSLDIFRSELSDLLTYKSKSLYELFDKLKVKYRKKASYEELLDIVLREIKTNEKFVRGLSFLIGEANEVVKKNKDVKWEKLLNQITKGINIIAKYFLDNPQKEQRFKRQMLDMIGLKSSVLGDDNRELNKKDNTVLWIIGLAVVGIAGYFIWRHYDKLKQDKLRAESLNPTLGTGGNISEPMNMASGIPTASDSIPAPAPLDPAYNVPSDVLLPETPVVPPQNSSTVQINVQPVQPSPSNNTITT